MSVLFSRADVGFLCWWLQGLSEVISHMLGGESQSFDFSIENQLLRCPLEKFFRITGLNTVRRQDRTVKGCVLSQLPLHRSCLSVVSCLCLTLA